MAAHPHVTETRMTAWNWPRHVNWLNVFLVVGIPLSGCISAFWAPLQWKTGVFAFVYCTPNPPLFRDLFSLAKQTTNISHRLLHWPMYV